MKMDSITTAKYNISRLTHTLPGTPNEKAVLKSLSLSAFPRGTAINVLLEILNVVVIIENRKERERGCKNL